MTEELTNAQREVGLSLPSEREIVMERVFKAPARTLFDVWTKPEHVRKWYGCRGTTVTVCDIDLRVGGSWRWVVARPGLEVAFSGEFTEIDPPRRLQRTERYEGIPGAGCLVTLTFDEKDGETTLTSSMVFPSKAERDACLRSGMEMGVAECYQNIDKLLETL